MAESPTTAPSQRPQRAIALRDLFWLMLVVALALCWRMDYLRLQTCRIRSRQVTDYLERVEDLRVEWKGNEMRINREL